MCGIIIPTLPRSPCYIGCFLVVFMSLLMRRCSNFQGYVVVRGGWDINLLKLINHNQGPQGPQESTKGNSRMVIITFS